MQEDVALTEAACPLSKSNYDNHASGKAVVRRTARQALIRQAAYLNHCSPPLQAPSLPNVEGLSKKGGPGPLRAPLSRSSRASPPWNIICCPALLPIKGGWWRSCFKMTDGAFHRTFRQFASEVQSVEAHWSPMQAPREQLAQLTFYQNTLQLLMKLFEPWICPDSARRSNKSVFQIKRTKKRKMIPRLTHTSRHQRGTPMGGMNKLCDTSTCQMRLKICIKSVSYLFHTYN